MCSKDLSCLKVKSAEPEDPSWSHIKLLPSHSTGHNQPTRLSRGPTDKVITTESPPLLPDPGAQHMEDPWERLVQRGRPGEGPGSHHPLQDPTHRGLLAV